MFRCLLYSKSFDSLKRPLTNKQVFFLITFGGISKDSNVLHLKSSNSHKLSYFPTSALLGHTSHHHIQPSASNDFLTWKNSTNLLQEVSF